MGFIIVNGKKYKFISRYGKDSLRFEELIAERKGQGKPLDYYVSADGSYWVSDKENINLSSYDTLPDEDDSI